MNIKDLSKPLSIDQIDFRVQSVNKGGYATILAYKNARVDQQRLDDVCGPLNWRRAHTRDNHNCIVGVWDKDKENWVTKEDTGTESNTEAEKGVASDSFKRACFNWGIGRELYDYPVIQIKLNQNEFKVIPASGNYKERAVTTWDFKLRDWVWYSEFEDGKISFLAGNDGSKTRFTWGKMRPKQ